MQIRSHTQSRIPHNPRNDKPSTAIYLCTKQRHKHLPPSIFQCIFIRNIFFSGSISVVVFRTCCLSFYLHFYLIPHSSRSTFDLYNPATFQFIIPHAPSIIRPSPLGLPSPPLYRLWHLHPVFYLPRCITIVGLQQYRAHIPLIIVSLRSLI